MNVLTFLPLICGRLGILHYIFLIKVKCDIIRPICFILELQRIRKKKLS